MVFFSQTFCCVDADLKLLILTGEPLVGEKVACELWDGGSWKSGLLPLGIDLSARWFSGGHEQFSIRALKDECGI